MKYQSVIPAEFISRPNRFIAQCRLPSGEIQKVHVKNTGRCKELLLPGAAVYLEPGTNPARKTAFSLITVQKGKRLINMDSQAPNCLAEEALKNHTLLLKGYEELSLIKREQRYGSSRFDFYLESGGKKAFMEVKGVTLEENGAVFFPDAPTERGIKHIEELCRALEEGYDAFILFVIQMKDVSYFSVNDKTHKAFGDALRLAKKRGVKILAVDCRVSPDEVWIEDQVEVCLDERMSLK